MISRHEYRGGAWIDLEKPTEEEIAEITKEFSISKRLEQEILSPTPTPIAAADDRTSLLVLHFPAHGAEDGDTNSQEIDFLVGDHFIVTVRYEVVAPLYDLKKLLEAQQLVTGRTALTTDVMLEVLFAHLYTSVRDHTNHIAGRLEHVEREMFDGGERVTVRSISNISREFLHIEAALANQEEPLGRFLKSFADRGSFGASFVERTERIQAERSQVARLIKTHRAVATELRETNLALLEARQNEIMKTLTVITFGVLPLELITLLFGMHELGTPLEHNPNAFWIILAILLGVLGCMILFFAKKRWI